MSSKSKPQILTRAVRGKMYNEFLALTLAYFMEEGCFAETDEEGRPQTYFDPKENRTKYIMDKNKIVSTFNGLQTWLEAIYGKQETYEDKVTYSKHLISINTVRDIIFKATGSRPFN